MRGTKAKRIRREVYGDYSQRIERNYQLVSAPKSKKKKKNPFIVYQVINHPTSLRALYLKAKKEARKK